jgi:hypothetical protein
MVKPHTAIGAVADVRWGGWQAKSYSASILPVRVSRFYISHRNADKVEAFSTLVP